MIPFGQIMKDRQRAADCNKRCIVLASSIYPIPYNAGWHRVSHPAFKRGFSCSCLQRAMTVIVARVHFSKVKSLGDWSVVHAMGLLLPAMSCSRVTRGSVQPLDRCGTDMSLHAVRTVQCTARKPDTSCLRRLFADVCRKLQQRCD